MSKELEALRNFISECENDWKTQPKRWVDGAINSNVSKYMYSLKSIITPPTAEEVCKALSEFVGEEVIFLVNDKEFVIKCNIGYKYIVETDDVLYYIKVGLPLYLITLIGRFYEGVRK